MLLLYQGWGEGDWAGDRTGTFPRNSLHRVFINRAFFHTPPHPPAVIPAVCCNRFLAGVCRSLFTSATRRSATHSQSPCVIHRLLGTCQQLPTERCAHLPPFEIVAHAHTLAPKLLISWTDHTTNKLPALHLPSTSHHESPSRPRSASSVRTEP